MDLAVQKGLDEVTTEEIAIAAGVSTRTFFNYYPNKEAAAIGHPPSFSEQGKDALHAGTGPLPADIKRLLDEHISVLEQDDAIMQVIGAILKTNEKARGILVGFLMADCERLAETMNSRVKDRHVADALASHATEAIGRAIRLWERDGTISLAEALDVVWDGLQRASQLLAVPAD
ncbi:Transcriptional regulator, TetR family [Sulfitobacter donghicola DSW-25 = KCTC 12864 = JCM 14565]|nr:Transcriptional regulator, TetR family [Sulfitobacter donghicola DSW-25 = KCTC 12864 = JCM 14565]